MINILNFNNNNTLKDGEPLEVSISTFELNKYISIFKYDAICMYKINLLIKKVNLCIG